MKLHRPSLIKAALVLVALVVLPPAAFAKTCAVAIEGNDQMKFNLPAIKLAADCTQVTVTLKHTGKMAANVMGHNWVLAKTADVQPLAMAGMKASVADSHLPKGDARVIAFTKIVGGGQSTSVTFPTSKLKKGGDYTFFCSFPGHFGIMKGKLTFG